MHPKTLIPFPKPINIALLLKINKYMSMYPLYYANLVRKSCYVYFTTELAPFAGIQ